MTSVESTANLIALSRLACQAEHGELERSFAKSLHVKGTAVVIDTPGNVDFTVEEGTYRYWYTVCI